MEQLQFLEQQFDQQNQELASLPHQHQDAIQRLVKVPGLGVDSGLQIIAKVGPVTSTFPPEKCFSKWVGTCHGDEERAGIL